METGPMTPQLEGKVALITGAGTGIGAATARLFAHRGARPVLFGLRSDALTELGRELAAPVVEGDVTVLDDVERATETGEGLGGIDILVNGAGIMLVDDVATLDLSGWDLSMAVNLTGTMLACRAVLPAMVARRRGSIVNIASIAAFNASEGSASYAASKAGVVGLTRSIAYKYGPDGVRSNCLCPGWTRTPMSIKEMDDLAIKNGTTPEEEFENLTRRISLRRVAEPLEIAACVAFLASDEASFVTGATLVADGGGKAPATSRAR
jgi:NAD(P)-dependent dehydrogenase (short-subunit alcohol dehydrogenase family)